MMRDGGGTGGRGGGRGGTGIEQTRLKTGKTENKKKEGEEK